MVEASPVSPDALSIHPAELKSALLTQNNLRLPVFDELLSRPTVIKGNCWSQNGGCLEIRGGDERYHEITPEYAASARIQFNLRRSD